MRTQVITYKGKSQQMYYFDTRFFRVDGKRYEITSTDHYGAQLNDIRHVVKDEQGNYHTIEHRYLIKRYEKIEPIYL